LIQLIVERGAGAVEALPKGIRESKERSAHFAGGFRESGKG
jgi:hypothetical protein